MAKPIAPELTMPQRCGEILEQWIYQDTGPQHRTERAKLVLIAADGVPNIHIAYELNTHRDTVSTCRHRFVAAQQTLFEMESVGVDDRELESALASVVDDAPRPSGPSKFELEEVVSIVQLACTCPNDSGIPIGHWTPNILAQQAVEQHIMDSISPSSVQRFLKRS